MASISGRLAADLVASAAAGDLPPWSQMAPARRDHARRVAELLGQWAGELSLDEAQRDRWRAAGWLHDALRDAPAKDLRAVLPATDADLPEPLLHGPAAAFRLDGVVDDEIANAIRYHTVGHPSLGLLGKALYLADFLEPGRSFSPDWRDSLRGRMPHDLGDVLREVLRSRIIHLMERNRPLRVETVAFWNSTAVNGAE